MVETVVGTLRTDSTAERKEADLCNSDDETANHSFVVEEKRRVVRSLLSRTSPGQLLNVLEDCQLLIEEPEVMKPRVVEKLLAEANECQLRALRLFPLPGSKMARGNEAVLRLHAEKSPRTPTVGIICSVGRVRELPQSKDLSAFYLLPRTKQMFAVDFLNKTECQVIKDAPQWYFETPVEEHRRKLEDLVEAYLPHHFNLRHSFPIGDESSAVDPIPLLQSTGSRERWRDTQSLQYSTAPGHHFSGPMAFSGAPSPTHEAQRLTPPIAACAVYSLPPRLEESSEMGHATGTSSGFRISVVISSWNVNLRNLWSGCWISQWNAELTRATESHPTSSHLEALVSVKAHYFEDCNVQFSCKKRRTWDLPPDSLPNPDHFASAVAKIIESFEREVHLAVVGALNNDICQDLRMLRRPKPVGQGSFDWSALRLNIAKDLMTVAPVLAIQQRGLSSTADRGDRLSSEGETFRKTSSQKKQL